MNADIGTGTTAGRGGFTGELWASAEGIYAGITEHPFLLGLADGTLPEERFRYYVVQDALYLREYARALALAGVRAGDDGALAMFCAHATGALDVERSLHEGFLAELGVSGEEARTAEPSPTTLAYTSFLIKAVALGDYAEALGAVLPCYWIYERVGKRLLAAGSPDPRYARWIDTYGGEEFGTVVRAVLDLTDRVCAGLDPAGKARARSAFVATSRYEWMFWDAAWRLEGWPV